MDIGVTPDDLHRHAAHVDAIGAELGEIRRAGEITGLGSDAYGRLCAVVPALLSRFQEPLTAAIGSASASARDTASAVRGVAGSYEAADEAAAAVIRDAGRD